MFNISFKYLFSWWDVIWPLCHRVSSLVKVDVEGRKDHINILKYVHIKKLCVENAKPSATVSRYFQIKVFSFFVYSDLPFIIYFNILDGF